MAGRERYTAKARASSRKKGKKKRAGPLQNGTEVEDPNMALLHPKSKETKENDRKEKIRRELSEAPGSRMNSKKRRRLEKYIDKKLKKEERHTLFEKLVQSQAGSTSAKLVSSSSLGTGQPSTHEERFSRLEDKETRRAFGGLQPSPNGTRKRKRRRISDWGAAASEDENYQSEVVDAESVKRKSHDGAVDKSFSASGSTIVHSAIGSALCRNPDGTVVKPNVVKRRPKHGKVFLKGTFSRQEPSVPVSYDVDSSSLFDSSDSAYDSSHTSSIAGCEEEEWTGFTQHGTDGEPEGTFSQGAHVDVDEQLVEVEENSESERPSRRRKPTGFKDWAIKQLHAVKGHEPSQPLTSQSTSAPSEIAIVYPQPKTLSKSQDGVKGPLGELLPLPSTTFAEHIREKHLAPSRSPHPERLITKNVPVERLEEIQAARLLLPIIAEEQLIMEAILLNPVVVIYGETGSGKTTQVPQFLYEAGFGSPGSDNPGMIGVTQPRRVAAMSMASRVATELSLPSSRVSYQIRYDATVSPATSIKFMTDGVLLRELATDLLLRRYSVIIVDEAHERSMNTDILIGVLSRVVRLRQEMWEESKDGITPLRLIIMSATLRVSDFTSNATLFPVPPPVISITARQHPVTIHFNRRTIADYVTEAVRKTVKIHARLPPGGILIFLTGQNEILGVSKKLEARFGRKAIRDKIRNRNHGTRSLPRSYGKSGKPEERGLVPTQVDIEAEDIDLGADSDDHLPMDVDGDIDVSMHADELDGGHEESDKDQPFLEADDTDTPMHIVPLYSLLSSEKQMDVFKPPPPDSRLVVVATNVAETSLTIPGIRYVVDCGRAKERKYDVQNGIQSFQVSWISKASAAQRAGRAGRTGPGHCYRLYSSALFEHHFGDFTQPEILRVPIEGVVLQMKSMNIDTVVNFPFPTPPDRMNLKRAETILRHLGSLEGVLGDSHITDLGRAMAMFPVSPRFSKMLVAGRQHGCLQFVIAIVSALSVGDPFLHVEHLTGADEDLTGEQTQEDNTHLFSHIRSPELKEKEAVQSHRRAFFLSQQKHASLGQQCSDVFRMLSVVGAYEFADGDEGFCAEHFVRPKAMKEIHKLRSQIAQIVQANFPDVVEGFAQKIRPPNDLQLKILRQIITAGFIDQVAVRKDVVDKSTANGNKYASSRGVPYKALGISDDVFIHPSSILYNVTPPEYVVFQELVRTSRPWIKTLTIINPTWLPKLGPTLCTLSKQSKPPGEDAVIIPKYGPTLWELPPVKVHTVY